MKAERCLCSTFSLEIVCRACHFHKIYIISHVYNCGGSLSQSHPHNCLFVPYIFLQDAMKSCGDDFVKQLATTTEQLLLLLDSELTVDDVITGSKYIVFSMH